MFAHSRTLVDITNRRQPASLRTSSFQSSSPAQSKCALRAVGCSVQVPVQAPLKAPLVVTTQNTLIDIDMHDKAAHLEGADFAAAMHANALSSIALDAPSNYLPVHSTVTSSMRAILVDWLADLSLSLRLTPDTFHSTVHILDRYLSARAPRRSSLQLVGATSLLIASKIHDIYAPSVMQLCALSDGVFSPTDVLREEARILSVLNFRVCAPGVRVCLARLQKAQCVLGRRYSDEIGAIALFVAELAMVDGRHLKYHANVLGAAAFAFALQRKGEKVVWCLNMQNQSGCKWDLVESCLGSLREMMVSREMKKPTLTAIARKHSAVMRRL